MLISTLTVASLSTSIASMTLATTSDAPHIITHSMPAATGFAPSAGERAFSVSGVWCNVGGATAVWNPSTPNHPVTATNLYRVEGGVLEHLGASWAHHHICALERAQCMTCTPSGTGCTSQLGVGCSTTSSASFLGQQASLAPRSQVNAATGVPTFPFSAPAASGSLARRCRVPVSEFDPAQHAGAAFAFETVTLHPSNGVANDLCVTRPITAASLNGNPIFSGPGLDGTTAVEWWKSLQPDVDLVTVDTPDDGRVLVAATVLPLGDGLWRYVYAIENLDSHEAIRGIAVPLDGATSTFVTQRFPLAHSGEVTSNDPWTVSVDTSVRWSGQSVARNPNANAVRWGTTYTVTFIADRPPADRAITLTRFLSDTTFTVALAAPTGPDLNDDGSVNAADLAILLGGWGRCGGCAGDFDADGVIDATDLSILLGAWDD